MFGERGLSLCLNTGAAFFEGPGLPRSTWAKFFVDREDGKKVDVNLDGLDFSFFPTITPACVLSPSN